MLALSDSYFTVSGTIWADYKPQVEGLDKLKYTIVVMEQPGFGRSQPPERNFSTDMFHRDADWGAKLMQVSRHNDNTHVNLEPDNISSTKSAYVVR
jgi:pimeloyl-ACP methyl ester carboxylesterase